ncbi:DUF6318 family protein [Paenarthrobacter sp. NPDC089316]|uniref:DUF6318 family protein n=1 Tax=unclassified Paenarthrobacter TaxID=2634190 RepID=UPI0034290711
MSRLSSAFLSSLLAALLLSGCQGGSPGAGPSETSTTTASPTLSVSSPATSATSGTPGAYKPADAKGKAQNVPVPVMPELARENSKAGLEAFIGYWYATYSYATETGDLEPWLQTTDTSNTLAATYKKALERNYSDGRWMVGGQISTPVIEVNWTEDATTQEAKVQVIQSGIQYFNADGTQGRETTPSSNIAEAVFVRFTGGSWMVVNNGLIVG